MIVEIRIPAAATLPRTIARTGDGISQACNLLQGRGLDRTRIRVHGYRLRRDRDKTGVRVQLVYRVAPDTMPGDVWSRKPERVLIVG